MNGNKSFSPVQWFFHCLVLWSLAVAQPLYSKIAENLPFLLAHSADAGDIVRFSLILLVPAPLLLWGFVYGTWRVSARAGVLARFGVLWVLVTLTLLPLLRSFGVLPGWMWVLICAGLAWLPARYYTDRVWNGLFDMLTPAPVLFLLYFLLISPASVLVLPDRNGVLSPAEARADIPVVMVMLDEFPTIALLDEDGSIDTRRYPGFARLAGMSTWYPRATTVSDSTVMAVPAFLTGIMPVDERRMPPLYHHYPENLFDRLGRGRTVRVTENGTRMCRPSVCFVDQIPDEPDWPGYARLTAMLLDAAILWGHIALPNTLRGMLPGLGARWAELAAPGAGGIGELPDLVDDDLEMRWNRRVAEFDAFIDRLHALEPNAFYYYHFLLPHAPWVRLPGGQIYDLPRAGSVSGIIHDSEAVTGIKHMWHEDEAAVILGQQRFLLQVAFVDGLIGRMLDALEASGRIDRTLLIVAADHGSAFTAGTSRRAVTAVNFAEIAGVPLFIKYPDQETGRVDDRTASLLDASPTVRAVLDLREGTELLDGEDLRSTPTFRRRERCVVNDRNELFCFTPGEFNEQFRRSLGVMHDRFAFEPGTGFPRWRSHVDWYGRNVTEWRLEDGPDDSVRVEGRDMWMNVSLDARFMPVRIHGTLHIPVRDTDMLAASVDGLIAGVARPYSFPGSSGAFEVLIDPEYLKEGANDLVLYLHRADRPDAPLTVLHDTRDDS